MTLYEKALAVIESEHEIVNTVFKYIDRMNDVCDEDPMEKIATEFVKEVNPLIDEHVNILWRE